MLAQITAPHFCAGIVLDEDGVVTRAAPIAKYMAGWTREEVRECVKRKRRKARVVPET